MAESNQRVVVTKRMLKEGLMRLLKNRPLEKISITELCQEAGINRTTFYRYYELPRDVLTEIQNNFFAETLEHFQKPMSVGDMEGFFTYLAGGTYFLARKWIMEDMPMSPKEVAAVALSVLDKERVF